MHCRAVRLLSRSPSRLPSIRTPSSLYPLTFAVRKFSHGGGSGEKKKKKDTTSPAESIFITDPIDYSKMKVAQLKHELKQRGLPVEGNKKSMVEMLTLDDERKQIEALHAAHERAKAGKQSKEVPNPELHAALMHVLQSGEDPLSNPVLKAEYEKNDEFRAAIDNVIQMREEEKAKEKARPQEEVEKELKEEEEGDEFDFDRWEDQPPEHLREYFKELSPGVIKEVPGGYVMEMDITPQDDDKVDQSELYSKPATLPGAVVSPEWFSQNGLFRQVNTKILDASWFMPNEKQNPRKNHLEKGRIPLSRFFDLDEVCDKTTDLPHMLPTPEVFAKHMSEMGISNKHRVLVYDSKGIFSGPRLWWMLRVFGAKEAAVINGGLFAYKHEEVAPLEYGRWESAPGVEVLPVPAKFKATMNKKLVVTLDELLQKYKDDRLASVQILDARSEARFKGEVDEPRPGLRRGHIPGSINVPFTCLIQTQNPYHPDKDYPDEEKPTFLKPRKELREEFLKRGVKLSEDVPIITSCGSGVTAAIINLALYELGIRNSRLYDGSWAEWGGSARTTDAALAELVESDSRPPRSHL